MLKDTTYSEKMAMLKGWLETIFQDIKKDIKNDHLKKDWNFAKSYFPKKNLNKLSAGQLAEGYAVAIDGSEQVDALGEFIANRWLLKNTDVYDYFARQLNQVTDDFDSLDVLDADVSKKIMNESTSYFGAQKTYLFSVFNSVVFPEEIYEELRLQAQKERDQETRDHESEKEQLDWAAKEEAYEQQISRLHDKYDKKFAGLEKKYLKDVEALKKQISTLQRKLDQQMVKS
ncbi:MAG: hypothetical protein AAGG81_06320 [Chlamydiota bacterium]